MQLLVRRSPFQSNRSPFWYFRSTSRQARTDRRGGALKYRPMRTIGCLQSGHGNGRSGTLLSQLDEPICLKILRQAKQAKWTLLVAVGTPGPFRIPATVVSSCAANPYLYGLYNHPRLRVNAPPAAGGVRPQPPSRQWVTAIRHPSRRCVNRREVQYIRPCLACRNWGGTPPSTARR